MQVCSNLQLFLYILPLSQKWTPTFKIHVQENTSRCTPLAYFLFSVLAKRILHLSENELFTTVFRNLLVYFLPFLTERIPILDLAC